MPDILADLEGFLGKDAADKLRSDPSFKARLEKGEELRGFYTGENDTPPEVPARREDTPAPERREPPPAAAGDQSLSDIMRKLDSFGNIDERITSAVDKQVKERGSEMVGNAIASSLSIMREVTRLDTRHHRDFGTDLDETKLNAHIEAAKEAGRPFRTVTDAYEDMTRSDRETKRVEEGVREALKTRASANVPGVSPTAASPMLRVLKTGNAKTGEGTHLDRAATALTALMAEKGETVQ